MGAGHQSGERKVTRNLLGAGKLFAAGIAALTVSGCSWFDDGASCTRCAAKTSGHVKVAAVRHKPQRTAVHLPSHAKPGQCWGRVRIPARYESRTEQVLVAPATTRTVAVPAKYGWTTKRVIVREAREKVIVIPATYREVAERVLVAPMQTRVVPIPAQYRTESHQVLVRPAGTKWIPKSACRAPACRPLAYRSHQSWKRKNAHSHDRVTRVMCLVHVPAVYRTETRRILINEASSKRIVVRGPQYRTVVRRVLVEPSRTIREKIPAEYKTVRVREIVEPARERQVTVPAVYRSVTKQVQVAPEKFVWKQVVCKSGHHGVKKHKSWKRKRYHRRHQRQYRRYRKPQRHMKSMKKADAGTVRRLQLALKRRGYNPGPIDGLYGPRTRAAMIKFQRNNRLAHGQLTVETVRRLGIATVIHGRG